jgi:predicted PurR-regulated permease PerM
MKSSSHTTFSLAPKSIIMVVLILAVALGLWQLKTTLLVILLGVVLASFVDSGVQFLKKFHIPRGVTVVAIYLSALLAVGGFLYLFIPAFLDEMIALIELLPQGAALANIFGVLGEGTLKESLAEFSTHSSLNPFELVSTIRGELSALNIFESVTAFFGGVFNLVLVIVVSFYLSVLEDGVGQFLRIVTPLEHEDYVLGIWNRSQVKIAGWFRGQLLLACINGVLTYIGLLFIGVPYALILGILAIFFSLIPYGILLSGILAVAIAFFTGGFPMALTTFLLIAVLQQLENYIWQPLIIKSVTGVPSLMIIISLVIGAQLAGLMGLLLAIPVSVVILEIIHDSENKRSIEITQQKKDS